jgi:hypothetical protein
MKVSTITGIAAHCKDKLIVWHLSGFYRMTNRLKLKQIIEQDRQLFEMNEEKEEKDL